MPDANPPGALYDPCPHCGYAGPDEPAGWIGRLGLVDCRACGLRYYVEEFPSTPDVVPRPPRKPGARRAEWWGGKKTPPPTGLSVSKAARGGSRKRRQ